MAWDYYYEPTYESEVIEFDPLVLELIPVGKDAETEEEAETVVYPEEKVGWIQIDDIEIDDPVMQTTDNSYYLTHDEFNNYSIWGSYYVMAGNNFTSPYDLDRVTVIFGHSNGNSLHRKFSVLKTFKDPAYAKEHPYIKLWVGDTLTVWQVFAVGDFPVAHDYMISNPDDEYFQGLVRDLSAHSLHQYTDNAISDEDKVLILSTCSGTGTYETRFLVCAKLVGIQDQ